MYQIIFLIITNFYSSENERTKNDFCTSTKRKEELENEILSEKSKNDRLERKIDILEKNALIASKAFLSKNLELF